MIVEEGRVAIKLKGRDAGKKVVITKVLDKNFVMVLSEARKKERRVNINHLELLNEKVDINKKEELDKVLNRKA
ncbi:MAG: 50S ribosomal protein L14e [Candidatus Micrarchaeota archaeon]|nr:MAG: 50S ribosomal protein L14e [Candidatus Micrarchaeota archaeon]